MSKLLLILFTLITLGKALPSTKIVGGEDAIEGEFPHQIRITMFTLNTTYCGGSLVEVNNKQFVISAATCFHQFLPPIFKLVAGDHDTLTVSANEQIRQPIRFIPHEDFDFDTMSNDIVIITYDQPFNLTEFVKPIPLPQAGQNTTGEVIITGWGEMDNDGKKANRLQKLNQTVISDGECTQSFIDHRWFHPQPNMMCAANQGRGSNCLGDYGGPATSVDGGYLAGIIIYSPNCDGEDSGSPEVFTEVSHHLDWIIRVANDL